MQHQGGGGGGADSQYGEPEAASPISSRPPAAANFEEMMAVTGGLAAANVDAFGGEDRGGASGSGGGGNRWPRQETLALLKIRSEMDATFRDASLKGPLWEDVSRKLAELGYKRSAKKCKEKFENVHKYYKRTKEGRAGRQDGKSYRFFSELEAMAATTGPNTSATASPAPISSLSHHQLHVSAPQPTPVSAGIAFMTNPITSGIIMPQQPPPPQPPSTTTEALPPPFRPQSQPQPPQPQPSSAPPAVRVSFSSDSASSSDYDDMEEDDDDEDQTTPRATQTPSQTGLAQAAQADRKRKRGSSSSKRGMESSSMMEFFEGLMRQVMQKQEALQQKFLEAVEKREQDRMIREEAWKRQEMARMAREHELIAQERAMSASRDAAIISFLQKITGQTIHLPSQVTVPAPPPPSASLPPPAPAAAPAPVSIPPPAVSMPPPPPPPTQQQQHQPQQQQQQQQTIQQLQQLPQQGQVHQQHQPQAIQGQIKPQQPISTEIVVAVPEQQVPQQREIRELGSSEASSSRWPKTEVLALIELRSGLEPRYQEAGPKGPLWEEISAAMHRIGYKRNAKRCKEKWENINKYFKKVKESNKKRPEDAKTCPYFHQLDALYRKKILGGSPVSGAGGGGGGSGLPAIQNRPEPPQPPPQQHQMMVDRTPAATFLERSSSVATITASSQTTPSDSRPGGASAFQTSNGVLTVQLFGEGVSNAAPETTPRKPEDTMKEQQQKQQTQQLLAMDCDKNNEELDSDNMYDDDEDDDDEYDDLDHNEDDMKMSYKMNFQRQTTGSSNGEGNGAPSFLAMVQ